MAHRTYKWAFQVAAVVGWIVVCSPATQAERIYQFINYPELQLDTPCCPGDLFTDAAFVAVVDTAVDDGLLEAAEIVSWSVTFESGLTISSDPPFDWLTPTATISGVAITDAAILLPAGFTTFVLEEATPPDVGALGNAVSYSRNPEGNTYQAGEPGISGWLVSPSNDAMGGDPWVIARVIPEPDSFCAWATPVIMLAGLRRRRRLAANAKTA